MARGLEQITQELQRAYANRDTATMKRLIGEHTAAKAAFAKSLENVVAEHGTYGPDVSGNQFATGYGRGAANVLGHTAQLLTPRALEKAMQVSMGDTFAVTREARAERRKQDEALLGTRSGMLGSLAGEIVSTAPAGGLAGKAAGQVLGRLPAAARAIRAGEKLPKYARYGSLGAEGAAGSLLTEDDATLQGALTGIVGGRLLQALGAAGRLGYEGLKKSKAAQKLLEYGADLTPGQLNPRGLWARLEGAATSGPGAIGTAVSEAQRSGLQPVVPNLVADLTGMIRREGDEPFEALARSKERVGQLYESGENLPIAPEEMARLRAGRSEQAAAMRGARDVAEEGEKRAQTRVGTQLALQKAKFEEALARARKSPSDLNVARAADEAAKLRQIEHKSATLDPGAPRAAGREAARKAGAEVVPEAMKDLHSTLGAALNKHSLARAGDAQKHIDRLGRQVLRGRTTTQIKRALTEIRRKKHDLKYGPAPTPTDLDTARVYGEVEDWFQKQLERAIKDPNRLQDVRAADKIYRELAPIREAEFEVGATPSKLVPGKVLEKHVKEGLSVGGRLAGLGGEPRQVAEALRAIEDDMLKQRGAMQSRGLHRVLALLQGTVGAMGALPAARRLARGEGAAGLQRTLRLLAETPGGQKARELARFLRPGVGAADYDTEDE